MTLRDTAKKVRMSPFLPADPRLEAAIKIKGEKLFALMDQQPPPALFSKKGAYARLMEWSMKDPAFKTQLFRFVDVLPTLQSSAEIVRHLQEYLGDKAVELNPALKAGLAVSSYAPALVATPVKAQIVDMANQFVAGESGEDLLKQIRRNAKLGLATTIDLLGETVVNDAEADAFLQRNLEVLDSVSKFYAKETEPAFSDIGPRGALPRLNLSVKISALTPRRPSGGSGKLPHRPEVPAPSHPASRRRGRRVHQLRHGELQVEGPHLRAFQIHP